MTNPSSDRLVRAAERGKWYTGEGQPCWEVPNAKGDKMIRPDIRHARKMHLIPSVTSILGVVAKPGLDAWKQEQLLLAALTTERNPDESDQEFANRIIADSKEWTKQTAELGTRMHAEIADYLEQGKEPELAQSQRAAYEIAGWLDERNLRAVKCEQAFVSGSFGGCADMVGDGFVADIKTTDLSKYRKPYPEWGAQIAAYAQWFAPDGKCAQFVVDRDSGELKVHEWTAEELADGWERFIACKNLWQVINNYRPY